MSEPKISLTLGLNLAVGMALCTWVGHWVDSRWKTSYVFTILGACLGLVYMFYELWKIARRS